MTVKEFMRIHNCNRLTALGLLYHEVFRLHEQFPKVKRCAAFKTQTLTKIVQRYEWSSTDEVEIMQDKLSYDSLYTKLSASIVMSENEIVRSGMNVELANDRRFKPVATTSFIVFGEQ